MSRSTRWIVWRGGSAKVEGAIEAEEPTWVLKAFRGRRWVDLASGPMDTRDIAERVADSLNRTHPEMWHGFILRHLARALRGDWG